MTDAGLMERALAQARLGLGEGAMPIGAVLARNGDVLAQAYWKGSQRGLLRHPEHEVLIDADRSIPWKLRSESTLYTTLEPCLMCMGTAMSFFLGRIVYALPAPADGATTVFDSWRPVLGHPNGRGSYSLPKIKGRRRGRRESARDFLARTRSNRAEADFARRTLER